MSARSVQHLDYLLKRFTIEKGELWANSKSKISSFEWTSNCGFLDDRLIVAIVRHAHVCDVTSRNVTGHDII